MRSNYIPPKNFLSHYLILKWRQKKTGTPIDISPKWIEKYAESIRSDMIFNIKYGRETSRVNASEMIDEVVRVKNFTPETVVEIFTRCISKGILKIILSYGAWKLPLLKI